MLRCCLARAAGENPFSVLDPDEDMPGAMDCDTASGGGVRMRRGGGGSGAGVGGSVGRLASPAPGTATASSPAISINSSADVETDGSGDEDIEGNAVKGIQRVLRVQRRQSTGMCLHCTHFRVLSGMRRSLCVCG